MSKKLYVIAGVLLLLAACGPTDQISEEDQIATLVAEALTTQPTNEEAMDEPAAENASNADYGSCEQSDQVSAAYLKDGNVWLWTESGGKVQLTYSSDATEVQISGDGCRVAYKRDVPNPAFDTEADMFSAEFIQELWAVGSDGSGNQQLVSTDWLFTLPIPESTTSPTVYHFAFQPGSHQVAFNTRVQTYGLVLVNDIRLVNVDSGMLMTLREPGEGGNFYFSPDGSQVAFSTPTSVSVINADGSNLRSHEVSYASVITYSEYQYYPPVRWVPSGNGFMVAVPPEDGLAKTDGGLLPETALWYAPLDGQAAWKAGSIQADWFGLQEVQFAPDVGRIAYLRPVGEQGSGERELVIALSNGSNESAQIAGENIRFAAWAPDSQGFMFSTGTGNDLQLFLSKDEFGQGLPIGNPTGFPDLTAVVEWAEEDHYLLLHQSNEASELLWMGLDGVNVQIDSFNEPQPKFDVAP